MGAVKKKVQKVMGKGSSTDSASPAPAPAASTTPSPDGNVQASAYSTKKGKKSLIKGGGGMAGGIGYNPSGGDFALFLEELMKRKTLG
jgi:hypothetical protein